MATDLSCSYERFWSPVDSTESKCASLTTGACSNLQSILDYFSFYWCHLDGDFASIFFIILFFLPILFKALSNIRNEALFPSTLYLLEWFKCPKLIASLTVLPFFNISIEFFIMIAAAVNVYADSYNFSLIYAENLIFLGIVIPAFIFHFKLDVEVNRISFLRNLIFFLISTVYWIFVGGLAKTITMTYSLVYICFYLVYLLVVAYQNKKSLLKDKFQEQNAGIEDLPSSSHSLHEPSKYHKLIVYDESNTYKFLQYQRDFLDRGAGLFFVYQNKLLRNFISGSTWFDILELPFAFCRKLTIPPADPSKYTKLDMLLWPIPGTFFLACGIFGSPSYYWFYIIAPVCVFLLIFVLFTTPETEVPGYYSVVQIIAWACSIIWMFRLSQMLIDTLQFVSVFTNLSHTFLAIFLVAKLLSFQVIIPAYELIKKGERIDFFFSSTLFSQLFALIVGIGLANITQNAVSGSSSFPLFLRGSAILTFLILSTVGIMIAFGGILVWKTRYIIEKGLAKGMIWCSLLIVLGCLIAGIVLATTNII